MIYYTIWSVCTKNAYKHFEVVCFHLVYQMHLIACMDWMGRNGMLLKTFAYTAYESCILQARTESVNFVLFWWFVTVCKIFFCSKFLHIPQKFCRSKKRWRKLANNSNMALLCASMVVTYYIKLFRTGTDRHNGILMSLLLVAETNIKL